MSDHVPEPLPRRCLPDATAPASDEALWDARLRSLMCVAEPLLADLRGETPRWWEILAAWWRPAAGLVTAAAVALVIVVGATARRGERGPGAVALAAAAGDGAPAALWDALGSAADPVLAVIALEGGTR